MASDAPLTGLNAPLKNHFLVPFRDLPICVVIKEFALGKNDLALTIRKFKACNRAFSCVVMLSSNMAASIAAEININLCKHLSPLSCITISP